MTKETQNHVMTRTMELKTRNKLICSPLLLKSGADFGGTDLDITERIFTDVFKRFHFQLIIITSSFNNTSKHSNYII